MKKLLLMFVALVATVTISAKEGEEMEGWQKSFTPVSDSKELAGIHTAVAGDGSVYASSTYNQDFQFAEKTVAADPDGQTYSCIVKYDKDGNEKWAVTLAGSCTIHAMTADTDGTLYVAGMSEDISVTCKGTDNQTKTIEAPTKEVGGDIVAAANPAFIAKISKEGVFEIIKTIASEVNAEIHAIIATDWETMTEYNAYDGSYNDPMYFRPLAIKLNGDKVYVSAVYVGDVAELSWKGAYLNYFDMYIFDTRSNGVFSLNKSDLSSAANVAYVQITGTVSGSSQHYPEAIDFVIDNGTPYVAFIGFGNQTITTPDNSKDFVFATADDESGNKEHAMVLVNTKELEKAKVFHAAMHSKDAIPYNLVDAASESDNCILAGTFYGNFPLGNDVTKDKNTSFVASIKMSDCSVNWAKANEVESEAKCMVVTGEEIKASTDAATYTFKTATGDLDEEQTMNQSFNDADCYNDQYVSTVYTNETSVVVFSPKLKPSGINEAQAQKNGAMKYYNVNGVELSAPQKGLNIIKTAEGTRKVVK